MFDEKNSMKSHICTKTYRDVSKHEYNYFEDAPTQKLVNKNFISCYERNRIHSGNPLTDSDRVTTAMLLRLVSLLVKTQHSRKGSTKQDSRY